jgi:hypothetical protein
MIRFLRLQFYHAAAFLAELAAGPVKEIRGLQECKTIAACRTEILLSCKDARQFSHVPDLADLQLAR